MKIKHINIYINGNVEWVMKRKSLIIVKSLYLRFEWSFS